MRVVELAALASKIFPVVVESAVAAARAWTTDLVGTVLAALGAVAAQATTL